MDDPTRLLQRAAAGDIEAFDALITRLRQDMEAIAESLMRNESRQVTVEEGVLLSECYLRLRHLFEHRATAERPAEPREWQSREQFLRFATTAMRSILLDNARRRGALKRGAHGTPVRIEEAGIGLDASLDDMLFLDEAIERLNAIDPNYGTLLEYVRFGGLSPRAAGAALGLSRRRFEAAWVFVKAWVMRESGRHLPLGPEPEHERLADSGGGPGDGGQ